MPKLTLPFTTPIKKEPEPEEEKPVAPKLLKIKKSLNVPDYAPILSPVKPPVGDMITIELQEPGETIYKTIKQEINPFNLENYLNFKRGYYKCKLVFQICKALILAIIIMCSW